MLCIHVNPFVLAMPAGVASAIIERVGLKEILIAIYRVETITTATQKIMQNQRNRKFYLNFKHGILVTIVIQKNQLQLNNSY